MSVSWIKTGADSAAMAKKEAEDAARRKEEQGKMYRFWLEKGEECMITFVDGDLDKQGFLQPPRWYEHQLFMNGSWNNLFVCPEKTNPESGDKCPICEDGDRPSLVAAFTVIDHREFKGKNDKVYKDTAKILIAKSQSFELLNKLATKLKGLAGQTFDVSRSKADKSPAIGDMWLPSGDKGDLKSLQQKYVREITDPKTNKKTTLSVFVPADYSNEMVYRDGLTLRKMGFGKPGGFQGGQQTQESTTTSTNYSDDL